MINPVEPVPAYINISSIALINTPGKNVGSLSHKITDAWIYINNSPVGVFEVPFTIPILWEGSHNVRIRAGIMQNGIAATRIEYPFYADYDTVINFVPEQIHTINPVFSYRENTKFSLLEDFEGAGLQMEKSDYSDTILYHIKNDPVVFEGTGCGLGIMDNDKYLFEIVSIDNLNLPKNSPVYLEMNYKSELGFSCGVYANEPQQVNQYSSGLLINATDSWNKIYVDIAPAIASSSNASAFKLYIGALNNVDGTTKALYLDNIKVVHW
jgi:hypothetical protein